ncbi:MAG: nuclear transport factor 2 family protein [Hyphomicrobiales bacterium]|nr:nuclear transport factor 2 family protein [Hyphomicrobiales bacterium]MCP5000647.1 nuclear transport factor 2 family protein [Hyphomicrobiales bacterium]
MTALAGLQPNAQKSLESWHNALINKDTGSLSDITSDKVVFRSPAVFTPFGGKQAFVYIIGTVAGIFEDFGYHRQFATEDGASAVLEFEARIDDKSLKGIDMIRFDENGLICEFEVMIRPANALALLAQKMGEKAGPGLAQIRAAMV